ncbi:MAG: magnesium-dependent phosphatase-1 [Bacteroidales bacterium]|nr:magnesium-dependent phosphatase-1 [Bacteroidales bacterium]MBN2820083.1 magnesium-dependent phosphatase-1 [Bacteroidales bacterium]
MELIVFDLDFTLWNAGGTWCDHTYPPYRRVNNHVIDSNGSIIFLYPDAKEIVQQLHQENYTLAIASRTHEPLWAINLLKLFEIEHYFKYKEIYPGSKTEHFQQLQHLTKSNFEKMIFFDDEMRNVDEVGRLGVNTCLVHEGISWRLVRDFVGLS